MKNTNWVIQKPGHCFEQNRLHNQQ